MRLSKPHNPFNLPDEWREEQPWDLINCFKCLNAFKVPSHVYDIWVELDIGCPVCILAAAGRDLEEEE